MGYLGPDADIGGPFQCRQHFQFLEARLHFLGEPSSRTAAGLALPNGHRHHEVLLPLRSGSVRLQQWLKSIIVASISLILSIHK